MERKRTKRRMSTMEQQASDEFPLWMKVLSAGTAACIADLVTFPLDTAKVRMQVTKYVSISHVTIKY